ncbi:MAG: hypothetical protein KIH62_001600 [Candidatus Kerfeldbacteria bacterium]|nr:hypothetical protein [Candidatus Kerfeldbacteria bacterium]
MFENQIHKTTQSPTPPSAPSTATTPEPQPQTPMYTMPAKYIPERKVVRQHSWLPWVLLGVLVVILIFVSILAVSVYLQSQQAGQQTNTNLNTNTQNTNQNANIVSNKNRNTNTGATLNFNINGQLNTNIQTGLNGNTNTLTNSNTNTSAGTTPGLSSDIKDSRDKDRDGLTDVEEDLYATKFQLPDSDKDGYVDGTEVRGLFSPTEEGKTLLQSGLNIEYTNALYGWSIQYPKKWVEAPLGSDESQILFTSDTQPGEFVEVIVIANTNHQTAAEWYISQYPSVTSADIDAVTLGGLQGVVGKDGYVYYLANDEYIFTLVYQFGTKKEVHYSTTFEMMVKSFEYTAPAQPTNVNSVTNSNS